MTKPRTEIIAGITTFLTMSYIIVVNPAILATAGTGISFSGALTATVLLSFVMTCLMGLYAKLPFAVAPGMGINAFFTFTLILGQGIPWPTALGIVFWAGIIFLAISVTPIREQIALAIPHSLRLSAAGGIGIFLTFIGLKNAGIIAADPVTFVRVGKFGMDAGLAVLGFAIAVFLMRRKNPFAFLASMLVVTGVAIVLGKVRTPESVWSPPDFSSVFFKLDIWGALKLAYLPAILSIMLTDLFDSISTFVGLAEASGMVDEKGDPKNLKQGLIVDALATFGAGLFGTSSGTAYIESASGIESGGRTGLTAVATAFCFLPFLFLAPLAGMVPAAATAPILVVVGGLMFGSIGKLRFEKVEESLPAFLTMVLIPLTFSITQGIVWGFVAHCLLYLLAGRGREVSPMLYAIAVGAGGLLLWEQL